MSWREYAACRGRDPELFFPTGTDASAALQGKQAKRVCAGCAVKSVCFQWAVLTGTDHGVWGGMAEGERHALKTERYQARTETRQTGRVSWSWLSGPAAGGRRPGES